MEQLLPASGVWLDAIPLFFSSMLVKSGIILGIAGVIAFALRYSAASLRHMVLTSAMASLLLLPVALVVLPQWQLPILPAADGPVVSTMPAPLVVVPIPDDDAVVHSTGRGESIHYVSPDNSVHVTVDIPAVDIPPVIIELGDELMAGALSSQPRLQTSSAPVAAPAALGSNSFLNIGEVSLPWQLALLLVWVAGALFVIVRLLLAHAGVKLLVRRSSVISDEDWRFDVDRYSRLLEIDQAVRLRQSNLSSVPMIVGCGRPTLILPEGYDRWTSERRRIVLLHELAHIKRRDCLTQVFMEIVIALYWFNPMVWLASKQIRIEREIACDDIVLMSGTRASTYAETILETIKTIRQAEWSPVASIAMARKSDLEGRLISILDPDIRRRRLNRATSILAIALIAIIAMPVAMAIPVRSDIAKADQMQIEPVLAPAAEPAEDEKSWFVIGENEPASGNSLNFEYNNAPVATSVEPGNTFIVNTDKDGRRWTVSRNSYREFTSSVDTLTVAQLIKLRRYGVDSEYVDGLRALGYDRLSVDELINLSKYGVDPDYIAELTDNGFEKLSVEELIEFSKYGVDGDLVGSLRTLGYSDLGYRDIIELSKFGVDGDDIAELASVGFADLTVDELIEISKFGVDADEIAEFSSAGYAGLGIKDYVAFSKYGVDADDVAGLAALGYANLTADELVNLSKYGVDVDEIAELAAIGYKNITVDEMIALSKYGVDVDDVEELTAAGYRFSIDEMIRLGKYGVDGDEVAELVDAGYSSLSADDLINISKYGVDVDDVAEFGRYGLTNLSVDELIDLSKFGVDPELVDALREMGHADVSVGQLVKMAKYGVDADYIYELKDVGVTASIDEIIELGKHGVSPDYVKSMKKDSN